MDDAGESLPFVGVEEGGARQIGSGAGQQGRVEHPPGDLFAVEVSPASVSASQGDRFLDEEQTRRLWALLDLQGERDLSEPEQRELEALVDEYGDKFQEYHLRSYAAKQGISVDQARAESDERVAKARAWLDWLEADPRRRRAFRERAMRGRSSVPR